MYEWNEAVQKMIYWIEERLSEQPNLLDMSKEIGYSPYYCSTKFHQIVGMTMRSYIAGRRLTRAAIDLRDTENRILDIAIQNGYSSQEALTRVFVHAYGCTPAAYRRKPRPIILSNMQVVFFPEHYNRIGDYTMNKTCLTEPNVRMEYIPAHKYIGIWEDKATGYSDFWEYHNCDELCGIIESMRNVSDPVVGCHMAGWTKKDGKGSYFYGFGVAQDYDGEIPAGFEVREFPASYYLVFFHPPFDFIKDNCEVMAKVEKLAWEYNLEELGFDTQKYEWNEEVCQDYQRHYPEVFGYEVLRPVKRR